MSSQNGQTTSFTPDALGRLKSATLPDATQIDYKLDWDGRRATRAVNGTQTHRNIFENELRIAASREDGVVKEYVFGTSVNSPDYIKIAGVNYRIVKDHLGSPRLIVNATDGTIAQRMDYNEWGAVITDTNPGFQQYGFAGGIYDQATKLVKFGARDYNASVGRWTSKDPIRFDGGDTNLYGYVLQDPVNWIDPSGNIPVFPLILIGIGLVLEADSHWTVQGFPILKKPRPTNGDPSKKYEDIKKIKKFIQETEDERNLPPNSCKVA